LYKEPTNCYKNNPER